MKQLAIILPKALALALSFGAGLSAHADYRSAVLSDNPTGYWPLATAYAGSLVTNVATNLGSYGAADNGVYAVSALTGQPGPIAGDPATSVNTEFGNVAISDGAICSLSTFSLETWAYKTGSAANSTYQTVLDGRNGGGQNFRVYTGGYGQTGVGPDDLEFWTWVGTPGAGSWASVTLAANSLPVGQWFHLVFTFDGGNTGDMAIYTNGVLASNVPAANTSYEPQAVPFDIGSGYINFQGNEADVAVYSNILSASAVLAHYQAGANGLGGYVATVQADSPVGFWRLNETFPMDTASNVVNAGLNGVYLNNPKHQIAGALAASGNAATAFDANNNLMSVVYSATLNPSVFTAEAWLEPTAVMAPGEIEGCPMSSAYTASPYQGWLIYQNSTNFEFQTYNANGTTAAVDIPGGPVITPYTWYHVAVSWDGSVGRMYVNGVLAGASASTNFVPNAGAAFTVGGRSDGSYAWGGVAQAVALYKTNLSGAQILNHYQNGINASPAQSYASLVKADGAISYWPLGEPDYNTNVYEPNLGTIGKLGDGRFLSPLTTDTNGQLSGTPGPIVTESNNAATVFTSGSTLISIPLNDVFVRTNVLSFEIWYYDQSADNTLRCPAWWRDSFGVDTRGWVLYTLSNPNYVDFWQLSSTVNTWDYVQDELDLYQNNQWQHLVVTWDGTNSLMYVNGVFVAQNGVNNEQFMRLVDRGVQTISSSSYPFVGELAEAAYYTNVLSPNRIQAHYIAATGANPPAVLASISGSGASPTAPLASVATYVGGNVTVPAYILGTPPFTNQWYMASAGGVATNAVAGQTNNWLVFPSATEADGGNYVLVVSDSAGSVTSAIVDVSIVSSPASVVTPPQSVTRVQGIDVTLDVTAGGSLPIHYQWLSNGVAIAGATSSALTLSNIAPSFATNYSVTVYNLLGTNTSSPATLTVVPEAPGSYAASVALNAPIAYWRLDEAPGATNAFDIAGGYTGAYSGSEVLGQPGAILGDADTSIYLPGAGGIQIPFTPNLNPAVTFSVECWAKGDPSGAGSTRVLVSSRTSFSGWYWGYQVLAGANNDWEFSIGLRTDGILTLANDATNAADGAWHHLVGTYDDSIGDMRLYVDGQVAATGKTAAGRWGPNAFYAGQNPAGDEAIGSDADNDPQGALAHPFYGGIDEVAIYDYALSPAQVASHFAVGGPPELGIRKAGGAKVVVTWTKGQLLEATNLLGPWTTNTAAISPLTNSPAGNTMFYRATVANAP